jgi:hypothetical protein
MCRRRSSWQWDGAIEDSRCVRRVRNEMRFRFIAPGRQNKLIGLVGGPIARQVESDSDELSSKDGGGTPVQYSTV